VTGTPAPGRRAEEVLGIVAYTNVAPLHWGLEPWQGARFVRGVPTMLNAALLAGEVDLTLVSSVEFVHHRHELRGLGRSRRAPAEPSSGGRAARRA